MSPFQKDDLLAGAPGVGLFKGVRTIADVWARLDEANLFEREPQYTLSAVTGAGRSGPRRSTSRSSRAGFRSARRLGVSRDQSPSSSRRRAACCDASRGRG